MNKGEEIASRKDVLEVFKIILPLLTNEELNKINVILIKAINRTTLNGELVLDQDKK